jgi:hypothetical protein
MLEMITTPEIVVNYSNNTESNRPESRASIASPAMSAVAAHGMALLAKLR